MSKSKIGIVIIGRNEGERLKKCFESVLAECLVDNIIYVDSGSVDQSVRVSKNYAIATLELDPDQAFSAARARNEGFAALNTEIADLDYVQFIDGDCELRVNWLSIAQRYLDQHSKTVIVCGHRRETSPESSLYNQLIDVEWATPNGNSDTCGGDFLCRVIPFVEIGGFNHQLIAGEEPDLCFRLKNSGWSIVKIDSEMTLHDANLQSIFQWGKRAERSGYAYASGYFLHRELPSKYNRKELFSILFWGIALPSTIVLLAYAVHAYFLAACLLYPIKIVQISTRYSNQFGARFALCYSSSIMFAKLFQLKGVLSFYKNRWLGKKQNLVEYK